MDGKECPGSLGLRSVPSKYVDKLGRGKDIEDHLSDSTHDARPPLPVNADHQLALETVMSGTPFCLELVSFPMQVRLLLHLLVEEFATSARMRVSCSHAVGVLSSAVLVTGGSVVHNRRRDCRIRI